MENPGVFAVNQPMYAERGIATFPLHDDKVPALSNYQKIGLPASSKLALNHRFRSASSFGFMCNARTRVSVLDVDTTDENVLAEAMIRHGSTPVVARTASGKFHAFYRHNGERRKIRHFKGLPIDLLGKNGLVVATPSRFEKGAYSFIQGSLDDFGRLPVMRGLDSDFYSSASQIPARPVLSPCQEEIPAVEGVRNNELWRFCMQQLSLKAHDIDAIVAAAIIRNSTFNPPLPESEAVKIAASAWGRTAQGLNWFGQRGSYLPTTTVNDMVRDPYLLALISWLQAENAPTSTFWVADGLADKLGWPRRQLANARRKAIDAGWIVPINSPAPGQPVSYRWGERREAEKGVS
jgi:hypothetical protein